MHGYGRWFAVLIPIAKLLPPELSCEDLFCALKAPGDFSIWNWQDLPVAEAVHIAHLEAVDEEPVKAGEVVGALFEGWRMSLLPIARHRARHVHGVLHPRSWPRRFKIKFGCHACASQCMRGHRNDVCKRRQVYNPYHGSSALRKFLTP